MTTSCQPLPETIENVEQLEELLSRPTPEVIAAMGRLEGDLIVLGVGGKIGPSLARMARRASDAAGVRRRIIGVARFSTPDLRAGNSSRRASRPSAANCSIREQLAALPEVPNVLYLAAMKFGSTGQEAATWARNVYLPGRVCEKYRHSRIVAYSTGNVYPLTPVRRGGSVESDPLGPGGRLRHELPGTRADLHVLQPNGGDPRGPRPARTTPASCATACWSTWPKRSWPASRST